MNGRHISAQRRFAKAGVQGLSSFSPVCLAGSSPSSFFCCCCVEASYRPLAHSSDRGPGWPKSRQAPLQRQGLFEIKKIVKRQKDKDNKKKHNQNQVSSKFKSLFVHNITSGYFVFKKGLTNNRTNKQTNKQNVTQTTPVNGARPANGHHSRAFSHEGSVG
jgi:hypothetical protein